MKMKTVLYSFMMLMSSLLCLESVRAENEPQPPTEILITNTELSMIIALIQPILSESDTMSPIKKLTAKLFLTQTYWK